MEIVGISDNIKKAAATAKAFASIDAPVVIVGEPGTGRTHIARYIHNNSKHEAEAFIVFEIGGHTLNSELSVCPPIAKGLFGSARTTILGKLEVKPGAIENAGGGTIFIKNLQAVPLDLQPQILATIQFKGYKPVGAPESSKALCRFIFGLPKESHKYVENKQLIPELAELMAKNTITLLPLKKRKDDIDILAAYFAKKWCAGLGVQSKAISKPALKLLRQNPWHGNVAELQYVILNAVLGSSGDAIDEHHLQLKISGNWQKYTSEQLEELSLEEIVERKLNQFMQRLGRYDAEGLHGAITERVERPLIKLVMEKTGGNQLRAARILGINRNTLRTKLQKLRIEI